MPSLRLLLAALSLAAVLGTAGCGGSGSVSGNSGGSGQEKPAAIDGGNMENVAGLALSLVRADLSGASEVGDAASDPGLAQGNAIAFGEAAAFAIRNARHHLRLPAGLARAAALTVARTEDCDASGSVRISLTSADDNLLTLDRGDTLVLDFNACDQGDGRVDGRLRLSVTELSGRLDRNGSGTLRATFSELRFSDGVDSLTVNGSMTLILTVSDGVLTATADSSGIGYEFGIGGEFVTVEVREGSVSFTENLVTGTTVTVGEDFVAVAPGFAGSAELRTVVPLIIDPAAQILTGKLRVEGLDSTLLMTFLDAGAVLLELDLDNNGLIDITRLTSVALLPFGLP